MHYLDETRLRYQNEFEENIDRELPLNQRNPFEKWKGRTGFYYLYLTSKDYLKNDNEGRKDE